MTHGDEQSTQSASAHEIVGEPSTREETTRSVDTNDHSTAREEKERVLERVEREMDAYRKGEYSRFQASTRVADELDNWAGASDKEKAKAFDSYLAEINSLTAIQDEEQSHTRGTSIPANSAHTTGITGQPSARKRIRDEVKELLDQVSGEGLDGDADGQQLELEPVRKRAREEDMPWFNSSHSSSRRESCVATRKTLLKFSDDLSGTKSLLRVADGLPEGIPSTQWDRILRGESVDLNQILSAMHFVQLDEERKGRVGTAEVVFAVAESKRQVKTGAEWSSAFRRLSKAIIFLFPHRREELFEYAEHIEGLFSAKHTNAHAKVILYDQSVRNQVGGGQNTLLTDYQRFSRLSEAILHADGVEYKGGGKGPSKGGNGSDNKGEPSKKDICRRFNSQNGCRFSDDECYYKHLCKGCGKIGHGKFSCPTEKQQ